ncbi:glycosyltransferase family 4 protein [Solicola sp. PLA-1-18]|uniref:glycosyltransferase family 4 protein n=1 Tax=Solicola sp. PLA-1-18 TaxID=3380532 RepID=UPI003B7F3282
MVDLRVLMVASDPGAGLARHLRVLVDHLDRRGVRVSVCGEHPHDLGLDSSRARLLPVEIGSSSVRDALESRALRREVERHDLVHAFGVRAGAVAGLATARPRPLVVTWHHGLPRRTTGAAGVVERFVARRAAAVLCVADDLAERARGYGARDVRVLVPSAPILGRAPRSRTSMRAELDPRPVRDPLSSGRPIVLCIGRLVRHKGHHVLVDAAAQMVDRQPRPLFLVAGDGPRRGELERQAAALDAPVRFLGHRPDVADLLQAADVVVIPSLWDGAPLAVAEALRAAAPLVASDVGGIAAMAGDGALLVEPGDVDALARGIARVLDEPGLGSTMRSQALHAAEHLPTDDVVASQVLATYHRLMLSGSGTL